MLHNLLKTDGETVRNIGRQRPMTLRLSPTHEIKSVELSSLHN